MIPSDAFILMAIHFCATAMTLTASRILPKFRFVSISLWIVLSFCPWACAQRAISPPENPRYRSAADDVYLQEIGKQVVTDRPVTALAILSGKLYAVLDGKLHKLGEGGLDAVDNAPLGVAHLMTFDRALWILTNAGVYRFEDARMSKVFDGVMVDMALHNGAIHGATRDDIFRFEEGAFVNIQPNAGWLSSNTTVIQADGSQILADPVRIGPIERIASYSGTLYLLRPEGLTLLDGPVFQSEPVDWGRMPSDRHRDMLAGGSCLYVATDRGIAVLRGATLTTWTGKEGLPYEDTTCLADGFSGDLWIGTTTGAIRKAGDCYHYFGAEHWLPGDHVHDIAVDGQTVYVATDQGIGIIHYEPFTLRKKADYFEKMLRDRGHQRLGFVHQLYWDDVQNAWFREISDNDGGRTAHYLAAMCFKYAVTKDQAARSEAVDAFEAMRGLQTITGTDGFLARAIWAAGVDQGHRSTRGSGGLPAKWYETDDHLWYWKGDTSSDEVNAHFYAVSLFHDLVAQGEEKERAADHLARIARHIIDHGWVLRDMDGQPTRWGRWDPDYLLRPYGFEARGLNGMEAQTYMWTALKLSGDPRFKKGLDQLIQWRYHTYTVREKLTFPPESVVPWDDELAFRCFHPLLTYCDDPYLRSIYLRALERHWEVMRMQKVPFFNFIYGGLTGNDCEVEQAVQHLCEWSLDTTSHDYRNSHRADLAMEPGYTSYAGGLRAIAPREMVAMWGSRSAIQYDGGNGGRVICPPIGWLEDYWMGRYYGMIQSPAIRDPVLLQAPEILDQSIGAAPYRGPERPSGSFE